MGSIQNFIIGCVIAFVCGVTSSGIAVWKYQSAKYKEKALVAERIQKDALLAETKKTMQKENENGKIKEKLDELSAKYESQRQSDANAIRSLLKSSNGRVRGATVCETPTGTSDSSSGITSTIPAEGQLSAEFQEWLVGTLEEADRAAAYAEVAHEYALKVKEQRERMQNEQQ